MHTTCPYCGVGCGVLAAVRPQDAGNDGAVEIAGDPAHPANFGRLCSKGLALGETLGLEGRLLYPQVRGVRTSWNAALDEVAQGFARIIAAHGPDAVAFYVSGQLLTEDYYVANKLMKGFIGSGNIDTNSRLCMSSAVAAHRRAFGEDLVPCSYEDLELADLIVLAGSNAAWCHPVLFQRLVRAREQRPELKIVVIDPRRTASCELADLHLPVRSGTDVWLFNGLLVFLQQHGIVDVDFVAAHTRDAGRALAVAENTAGDPRAVARACRIDVRLIEEFYRLFARTKRVITAFSQGVNQSSSGTDKANAIINCHLLTGRIGKPGAGPFSLTGQPNAMGGREVGGLANTLAAHMDIENTGHRRLVQQFWDSPCIAQRPGLKAVDLFEAIHAGRVKAVWIMATNPVVSLPAADRVRTALERCELVVVSDCVARTDTSALAHVLLPAAAWGEKDGTVTNSERRISRQRAFLPLPGEARPDWWMVCEVAQRLGFGPAFSFRSPHEIFTEHAQLSTTANGGARAFDIGGLATLTAAEYDGLAPVQWPLPARGHSGTERLFTAPRFQHPDGRARLVPTRPRPAAHATDEEYPLVLNTGRLRDQWHSMARSGKAPRLTGHAPEPCADLHPQDALLAGLRAGALVQVSTRWGALVARLRTSGEVPRGMVFVPIHWSDEFSSDARVGALVNPAVDALSGEPEFKHTPARIAPFVVSWHGFALARRPLDVGDVTWWTRVQGRQFVRHELAGRRVYRDWSPWARRLLGACQADADWIEYMDSGTGAYRAALLADDRLIACLFLSPSPNLPARGWLSELFSRDKLTDLDRLGLLTGQRPDAGADAGTMVCSCFGIGRAELCTAIRTHRLDTTRQVGERLRAGTNCGSCIPEIRALIAESMALHDDDSIERAAAPVP